MDISSVGGTRTTDKGTRIVKPGNEMDRNAFLRILTAELANQDPMNTKDSTQYVAQMAQFSSLEQMANLNNTMTMASANSIIGKGVSLKTSDPNGNPYTGIVRAVSNSYGTIKIGVEVNNNGTNEIKEFAFDEVAGVLEVPDTRMDNMSKGMELLSAAAMIGKTAEFNVNDSSGNPYKGIIKGVYRDGMTIKLNVQVEGTGENVDLDFENLVKVKEV